jgi:hypothetical protein
MDLQKIESKYKKRDKKKKTKMAVSGKSVVALKRIINKKANPNS